MVESRKPVKFRAKRQRRERPRNIAVVQVEPRPVSEAPKTADTDKREKISMEEIDKKLDEIIKNI
jgi:hypothetical protein